MTRGRTDRWRPARPVAWLCLAPGLAFGDEGEGWLRWCFASRDPARLDQGLERLASALRAMSL